MTGISLQKFLEPQKGLQHLLAALPAVRAIMPGAIALIAGKEGRSAPQLREAAVSSDCDVRFLGHRTDIADLLAAADVFCFPSEREGFGGVLVEAMATGCPIVASSIPTTLEVLGRGEKTVGLLAPVADSRALTMAIVEVLADPAGSATRARRGRDRFEQHVTIEHVANEMASFFRQVQGA